jgi:hypothetical protein
VRAADEWTDRGRGARRARSGEQVRGGKAAAEQHEHEVHEIWGASQRADSALVVKENFLFNYRTGIRRRKGFSDIN